MLVVQSMQNGIEISIAFCDTLLTLGGPAMVVKITAMLVLLLVMWTLLLLNLAVMVMVAVAVVVLVQCIVCPLYENNMNSNNNSCNL